MKIRLHNQGRKGATLTMAVFALAVAMLSSAMLFGYISSVTTHQEEREKQAQAFLTQKSALEIFVNMQRNNELHTGEEPPKLVLGGYTTEITVLNEEFTNDVRIGYALPELADISCVGTKSGMLVAGIENNLLSVRLFASGSTEVTQNFPVEVCEAPDVWKVYGNTSGDFEAVIVCCFETGDLLYMIDDKGSLFQRSIPPGIRHEGAVFTSGVLNGEKVVVIATNAEKGYAVFPESDKVLSIISPEGTCPVIMPNGDLYGSIQTGVIDYHSADSPSMLDYFTGDFDRNGLTDLAWVHSDGMTCHLAGREVLHHDRADSSELRAWGFIEGRHGLGSLRRQSNGLYSWRKFYLNGFAPLPASSTLLEEFSGRIFGGNSVYFAATTDSTVLLSENEQVREIMGFPGDFDLSGSADIAVPCYGYLEIQADPGGRNARRITIEAKTGISDYETVMTDEYEYYIYPDAGNGNIVISTGGRSE